jgi:hypothetical protein
MLSGSKASGQAMPTTGCLRCFPFAALRAKG